MEKEKEIKSVDKTNTSKTDVVKVFQDAGINLKVSQNDILDLIVTEKWKEIFLKYQELKKEYNEINDIIKKERTESFVKNVKKKYSQLDDSSCIEMYGSSFIKSLNIDFPKLTLNQSNQKIEVELKHNSIYKCINSGIYLRISWNSLHFEHKNSSENFEAEISEKTWKLIESYKIKALDFHSDYDQLNLSKLKSAMKAELSHKVIENTPKEFRKQLEESFNIFI